jgi:hypothetical protein
MGYPNPFRAHSAWYWTDEDEISHGPYKTQTDALMALLRYLSPPWHQRMWRTLKRLWHDTRRQD